MKKIVYFSARTQFENMGDLLINRALLLIVNDEAELVIDTKNVPSWYIDLLTADLKRIKLVKSFFYYSLIRQAMRKKSNNRLFLFLKPGGYIGINNIKMGSFRFLQGILFRLLHVFSINVVRAPSSHSNSSKIWKLIDRFRLSAVDAQLIRDSLSIELLEKQNFNVQKIPDLAFYYFKNNNDTIFNSANVSKLSFEYTISFRKPRNLIDFEIYKSVLTFVKNKTANIAFTSQVEFDDTINSGFSSELNTPIFIYNRDKITIQNVLDTYSKSKFVISNRLHVLLVALLCGATPIALVGPNDKKIKGVFEDLGLERLIISYCADGVLETKEFTEIDAVKRQQFINNSDVLIATLQSTLE
jgi:hypothetical protein